MHISFHNIPSDEVFILRRIYHRYLFKYLLWETLRFGNNDSEIEFPSTWKSARKKYTGKLALPFNKRIPMITVKRIWQRGMVRGGGERRGGDRQFSATRRLLLNARTGHRSAGNSIAKSYILHAKILVNDPINFAEAADYCQWHTMRVCLHGYNCPVVVVMKLGSRSGWLVANRADVTTRFNRWIFPSRNFRFQTEFGEKRTSPKFSSSRRLNFRERDSSTDSHVFR